MSLKAPNLSLQGAGSHVLPPGISHGDIRVSAASNISGVLKDISMSYRHQRRRRPRQRSLTICAGGQPSIHGTTSSSAAGAYSVPTDIHSLLVNKPSSTTTTTSYSPNLPPPLLILLLLFLVYLHVLQSLQQSHVLARSALLTAVPLTSPRSFSFLLLLLLVVYE